eukprot:5250121-Pleurochrysis_carterae.AAC.2
MRLHSKQHDTGPQNLSRVHVRAGASVHACFIGDSMYRCTYVGIGHSHELKSNNFQGGAGGLLATASLVGCWRLLAGSDASHARTHLDLLQPSAIRAVRNSH